MLKLGLSVATMVGALAAAPAAAQAVNTYTYGTSLNSSVFTYGYGTAGTSFTPFTASYGSGCFGSAALACKTIGGSGDLPAVGINTGSAPITFYTNTLAPGTLFIQPGFAANGQDTIVNFVAPYAATYTFSGTISRVDTTSNGNGVNLTAFVNGVNIFGAGGSYYLAPTVGNAVGFGNTTFLRQGDTFSLGVGNNGDTFYDGTGITGTVTAAVPEPASWAMMLIGFGGLGYAMRRRSTTRTRIRFA